MPRIDEDLHREAQQDLSPSEGSVTAHAGRFLCGVAVV